MCEEVTLDDIEVLGEECLRKPDQAKVKYLSQVTEAHDCPDMLGTINCMIGSGKRWVKKDFIECELSSLKPSNYTTFEYIMHSLVDINVLHQSSSF